MNNQNPNLVTQKAGAISYQRECIASAQKEIWRLEKISVVDAPQTTTASEVEGK